MSRTKGKRFADKATAKELKKVRKEKEKNLKKVTNSTNFNTNKAQSNNIAINDKEDIINTKNSNPNSLKADTGIPVKKKKKTKNFIFNIIIVICVIAIIFSSYNIVIWFIDNNRNKALLDNIYNQVTVSENQITVNDKTIQKYHYDLSKLLSQNEDTVGWINVSNTNINYPVVQSIDNDYYLDHSFDKSQNSAGWVFADYRSNCSYLGYNTVIYGHNRKDQSMFGSLKNVLSEEWYSNEDNLYIHFSTLNESHVYRVFSTFICNDTDVSAYTQTDFSNDTEFMNYTQNLKNRSSHDFGTDIINSKHIITLYTCYGLNNQRLLVCASLVD